MARVTVEDCVLKVPNRFELVMVAAQRARRIGTGAVLTLDRDNDKNPVVALREIAENTVEVEALKEDLISSHQRVFPMDDDKDDVIEDMQGEEEWSALVAEANAGFGGSEDFSDDDDDEEAGIEDIAGYSKEDE
ncbi:MAG: DNA-directed RNA polymerase subunit omega [Alphaproteobacteria bacterium RIFCSPHIGHO2_12_FULL_45_9]|nr:MAG: DNA-directed RNA polymerase subunit omega [Alphaproteobacteria bacterium RIFCSPHIGHO2_02_FULL_46_13]OFW97305.1 MAG: DNA-directed RNA polymerase subunit omega [Alphaproteobacteria bacterium RIFCSPHIGHO2_12_FULL_45_9]